jgi:mono/diheme cytochrome c family protein
MIGGCMRKDRWAVLAGMLVVAACATSATTMRAPLGAYLSADARTGPQTPLRVDPNAHVILSRAAELPAASYLPSQATRGQAVYNGTCASCHEQGMFVGQQFVESWKDRRVYDFYALVRGTMPLDNPGGLTEQQYLDVVSYLLQANHAPPGVDSLRADTLMLRKTKIDVR